MQKIYIAKRAKRPIKGEPDETLEMFIENWALAELLRRNGPQGTDNAVRENNGCAACGSKPRKIKLKVRRPEESAVDLSEGVVYKTERGESVYLSENDLCCIADFMSTARKARTCW